jgi:PhnO protein
MSLKVEIRKVESKDLDCVFNFICELNNKKIDYEAFKTIFVENCANPNYVYYIAEFNGKPVGFISFHTQKLLHHCGIVGEIQEFFIDKEYRNKGIGKELINEVKKYAELNNLESIEVTSNKKRSENVGIYESLGFNLTHNKFTIYKPE